MTSRCPAEEEIGDPVSSPAPKAIDATSGRPALMNGSASRSDRSRVTKASRWKRAAYAALNGQLPVPSYR